MLAASPEHKNGTRESGSAGVAGPVVPAARSQRAERRAQLANERLRLLPRGEVAALVEAGRARTRREQGASRLPPEHHAANGSSGHTARVTEVIRFYGVGDAYGELSNFAPYPIALDGKRWPTSEHYFQAQKMLGSRDREEIRRAKTPAIAARLGRDRKKKIRRDWDSVKVSVMRRAVQAKFAQHDNLRALLLSTGAAQLVEHTADDDFWGDGGDGSGANMLGQILMQVRRETRLAQLLDRLEACKPGTNPGALELTLRGARHLLKYGEALVAIENLCSSLHEEGTLGSLPAEVYEEIACMARDFRLPEREYASLRDLGAARRS